MERPVKRQRITLDSLGTDDEDELDCEPNELNQRRDPVYQLEQARARASNKLKSRFENIFARYEKDFTGVGDEIDLRTGEIVVNNGHLQSITGAQEFGEGDEDKDDNADPHFSGHGHPDHEIGSRIASVRIYEPTLWIAGAAAQIWNGADH
ncbi:putative myb-like dna-binding domain protein [Diaporthe ampelina]|uniref:Putative myb-like dna-binding domain protein n=1 Tax=Diaporthe ampelina TaxID=1214573 RepID=A0A0G2FYH6_9PEZI|nr:putative myb-like dna-binding domain protein [Diaporthe ampelina]